MQNTQPQLRQRFRISWRHRHVLLFACCLVSALTLSSATAQTQPPKSFAAYCRGDLPEDARYTLSVILRNLQEDDYELAEKQLLGNPNLSLPGEGVSSLEPIQYLTHLEGLDLAGNELGSAGKTGHADKVEKIAFAKQSIIRPQFLGWYEKAIGA